MINRFCNISDSNWKVLNCKDLNPYFSANPKLFTKEKVPNFYIDIDNVYMNNFKKERITTQDILEQSLWLNKYIEINIETVQYSYPDIIVADGFLILARILSMTSCQRVEDWVLLR